MACREAGLSEEKIAQIRHVFDDDQKKHKLDLELLGVALQLLDEEDRRFLMECFNGEYDCIKRLAEKYGVTKKSIICRREKLVNRLRKEFFETEGKLFSI